MQALTATEAWEAVSRLDMDITRNRRNNEWCASVSNPQFQVGWGKTPLEAVESLLARLGEAAPTLPLGVQNGLARVEEMEAGK